MFCQMIQTHWAIFLVAACCNGWIPVQLLPRNATQTGLSVTATVNNVSFKEPIKLGSVVTLEAKVSRAFNSSMEVFIDVFVEDLVTGKRHKCNEAIYTFVAIDQNGSPLPVPELIPETDREKERFEGALRRKQLALILAGKMKPHEAKELKALFLKD